MSLNLAVWKTMCIIKLPENDYFLTFWFSTNEENFSTVSPLLNQIISEFHVINLVFIQLRKMLEWE